MRFFGHTTNDDVNLKAGAGRKIIESLKYLNKYKYITLYNPCFKGIRPKTNFTGSFGASRGWRAKHSSLDAKFTFTEIEFASKTAKNMKWSSGDLCFIIQLVCFLRQRSDTSAILYSRLPQKPKHVCVVDFDDVCSWLHITSSTLEERLKIMRKMKLGTYRIVHFQLSRLTGGIPKKDKFIIYGPYGKDGMAQVKDAFRKLKDIYAEATISYDSANPNFGSVKNDNKAE